ncbi:MAG: hypothetical protein OSJ27_08675 [Candidatus Gastranaerophilales bacterium]|nr:hypothetical protein [Candidatus Gastranaerophilales bacterium]
MNDITRQNCVLFFMLIPALWKIAELSVGLIFWIVELIKGISA